MRITTRSAARWGVWALGGAVVLAGLYSAIFFLPYPLFRHHVEHAGFRVFCDREIPSGFEEILDDARRRVEAMELDRGRPPPRIFICRSQRLFTFYVRAAGRRHAGQGLVVSAAGNMFLSATTIEAVARRNHGRPSASRLEGSWAAAIAHEVAHDLIVAEVGFRAARRLPVWKSEGYADYSANLAAARDDPGHDLHRRIAAWVDDRAWQGPTGNIDRRHFRWHLLVEYLCTVKGATFADLVDDRVTENATLAEMLAWSGDVRGVQPTRLPTRDARPRGRDDPPAGVMR